MSTTAKSTKSAGADAPTAMVPFTGPKHYWKALGRDAGLAVAKRLRVPATAHNRTMSLTLSGDRAEAAAALLAEVWTTTMAQFKEAGGLKGQWPGLPHAEAYAKSQEWLAARALKIAKEAGK